MLTPAQAVVTSLLVCIAGAAITWLTASRRRFSGWIAFGCAAVSSALALYAAGRTLVDGPAPAETFLTLPALGFALKIHVDGLTAWFIGLIASIALPAVFSSITYMDLYPAYSLRRYYPNLLLFIAAMYGLVSTTDMMWFFFIFWQLMTLPGYALIRFEHREPANRRAALKYLVMMQAACVLTMIGAELLAVSSPRLASGEFKYDFDAVSAHLPALLATRPGLVTTAFALFLVGFGIKLGMWPFGQFWLPDAHPAAPSPVSALLSGVMIKTGVYGLMRYFLWLVPAEAQSSYPAGAWGAALAVLGTVTLLTGTLQALKQEQTKRLLAFHSIGQAGYILLGLGTCLALLPASDWAVVALAGAALFGALLHTLNHALFKSLLFLNAGALLYATRTQDLNHLGGLLRRMPVTGMAALVASLSIAGVPLFNGFISKWCIHTAAVQGAATAKYLPVCAVIGLLASVLTLASFVKYFGAAYLGRAGRPAPVGSPAAPVEVGWMLRLPQVLLAGACVALGLFPALAARLYDSTVAASAQGVASILSRVPVLHGDAWGGVAAPAGNTLFSPPFLLVVLVAGFGFAVWLAHAGRASRRAAVPWLCGSPGVEGGRERVTAHHFYGELKRYLGWLGGLPHGPKTRRPAA